MTKPHPLVTVSIPTFNRLATLRVAVQAVTDQTYPAIELLICDNGSTDGTQAFVEGLVVDGVTVSYLRHESNVGPTANFNAGRFNAAGDYFMWLADDDWIEPTYVEQCVAALLDDSTIALVAGRARYWADGLPHHDGVVMQVEDTNPADRVVSYFDQVLDNATYYGVIPTEVLRRTSPLTSRMGVDWLFVAELAALGKISTIETTELWRDFNPDYTFQQMSASAGWSRFSGSFPYLAILGFAVREIVWGSPVFRDLGPSRILVAVRVARTIARRFVITGLRVSSLRARALRFGRLVRRRVSG